MADDQSPRCAQKTDVRVGVTQCFRSPTAWESLDPETLQYRLLLTLYGLGTGAGLKRVHMGNPEVAYKDVTLHSAALHHPRRITPGDCHSGQSTLRAALAPALGGRDDGMCLGFAAFPAWDQNLMTQWHARYGKPGVMIYWHVERKAACIYSQLKTCSSSEVAAMINGVLQHCTRVVCGESEPGVWCARTPGPGGLCPLDALAAPVWGFLPNPPKRYIPGFSVRGPPALEPVPRPPRSLIGEWVLALS